MKTEVLTVNGKEVKFEVVENEKVMVSSLEVAEHFGKDHNNVIKVIKREVLEEDFTEVKIYLSEYKDKSGKSNKMYLLDRDTFSFYVMGFTGAKAEDWKWSYIQAFNKMEEMLRSRKPALPDFTDPIEAGEAWVKAQKEKRALAIQNKALELENIKVVKELKEAKPFISVAKNLLDTEGCLSLRNWIKTMKSHKSCKGVDMKEQATLKLLMKKGVLYRDKANGRYRPYANYDRYFKITPIEIDGKIKMNNARVTGEGVIELSEKVVNWVIKASLKAKDVK